MFCKNCSKEFHWCSSCSVDYDEEEAMSSSFCGVECAVQHNPGWKAGADNRLLTILYDDEDLLIGLGLKYGETSRYFTVENDEFRINFIQNNPNTGFAITIEAVSNYVTRYFSIKRPIYTIGQLTNVLDVFGFTHI